MEPISGMISGAVYSSGAVAGAKETTEVQRPEEAKNRPVVPMRDEYIPEDKQEPSGRYWPGKDEDGQPKIYFDDPARAADVPEKRSGLPDADVPEKDEGANGPERKAFGDKAESCTCNTDAVDREIEKLKKKQEELKRQINSETDDTKIKELEKKLAQVEQELSQKDNDAYRHQHAKYIYF